MRALEHRTARCDILLRLDDTLYLQERFGWGWTAKIREITHEWVKQLRAEENEAL